MALYSTIIESYITPDETKYDHYLNEATVLLEGLFGTKYSKKDLEDPEKVKELLKQIHETPQSEFKKRANRVIALQLLWLIIPTLTFVTGFIPLLGLLAVVLALFMKIGVAMTEKSELYKLKSGVLKTIAILKERAAKTNDKNEKKKLEDIIDKLDQQLNYIITAISKARDDPWAKTGYAPYPA